MLKKLSKKERATTATTAKELCSQSIQAPSSTQPRTTYPGRANPSLRYIYIYMYIIREEGKKVAIIEREKESGSTGEKEKGQTPKIVCNNNIGRTAKETVAFSFSGKEQGEV